MKSKVLSVIIAAVTSLTAAAEADLSMYKPVDPTKNLVKNGTFETYWTAKKVLPYWGKVSENAFQDKTVKHSGNASLKIGNVPKSYASMAFNLGKIESLQNDLLIRCWCKYENINLEKPFRPPFIGIWTLNAQRRNSRTFPMVKVPAGSGDWFYIEEVVKVEKLKVAAAAVNPPAVTATLRVNLSLQPGWIWLDDVEIIPLEKK